MSNVPDWLRSAGREYPDGPDPREERARHGHGHGHGHDAAETAVAAAQEIVAAHAHAPAPNLRDVPDLARTINNTAPPEALGQPTHARPFAATPATTSDVAYVELHAHSCYSFLDGASWAEELVAQAKALGLRGIALTDHDNLHGAWEFSLAAHDQGIQAIIGAEMTLEDDSHLTLLVESPAGYRNLCRLLTIAHHHVEPGEDPHAPHPARLPLEALTQYTEGLILLTGCRRGTLSRLVDADNLPAARTCLRQYQQWFGVANVYVELQCNLVRGDMRRMARLAQVAADCGAEIVATGNVHYHDVARAALQDVMVAIRQRTTLEGSSRERRPNSEWALPSPALMQQRFRRYPQALANTVRIAERCAGFTLHTDFAYTFPEYVSDDGATASAQLSRVTHDLLEALYADSTRAHREKARRALTIELDLIEKKHLSGFFLIYAEIMQLAREVADEVRGDSPVRRDAYLPAGRGRGSSVSSVVCYLLGLSHIDPVMHDLFLGRFLNEDSSEAPDIDLDFPRDIRARLIERLAEVYPGRVGLVCAFATYRMRSAIRDVGMALGLPAPVLDRLAKLAGYESADAVRQHLARTPDLPFADSPLWGQLVDLCGQIARMPRHITQHSGGMVVSSRPLDEVVPLQPARMEGRTLIQWDKDTVSDARMVKIDLLGLGMLSAVEECLELIAAQGETPPNLAHISYDDQKVYAMIQQGATIGTFQIESRAQIQTLLKTKPENLQDLIVQVAIVRPGPIVGGATRPWIQAREQYRREGRADITYDHPLLEEHLKETYGVILYQEQILQVAMTLANFTSGQADTLRRAMSRRRSDEAMDRIWIDFRAGAFANDVSEETAKLVFDKIRGFARYGFPKAHSVSFAVLAYQTAYLRCYHLAELYTALLNQYPMGFYPPHVLLNDARRAGTTVRPLDINHSQPRCTVYGRSIRIGLGYLLGIRDDEASAIWQERERNGEYRSLPDLVRRVPLRREIVERLIQVGALDWTGLRRRELLWQLGLLWMQTPPTGVKRRGPGRTRALALPAPAPASTDVPRAVPTPRPEPPRQLALALPTEQDLAGVDLRHTAAWEQMQTEYRILGLAQRWHPLQLLRTRLPQHLHTAETIGSAEHGASVTIGGLVVCRQRPSTSKGVTFLLLEDETGVINIVVYLRLAEANRILMRQTPLLAVQGRFERQGDVINIIAERLLPLERLLRPADDPEQRARETAAPEAARQVLAASHNFH